VLPVHYGTPDSSTEIQAARIFAYHAVNALTCFGKDQLFNPPLTGSTRKTMRMIRFVACHDGLLGDGLLTDEALMVSFQPPRACGQLT